jgi:hypothetical protein
MLRDFQGRVFPSLTWSGQGPCGKILPAIQVSQTPKACGRALSGIKYSQKYWPQDSGQGDRKPHGAGLDISVDTAAIKA